MDRALPARGQRYKAELQKVLVQRLKNTRAFRAMCSIPIRCTHPRLCLRIKEQVSINAIRRQRAIP